MNIKILLRPLSKKIKKQGKNKIASSINFNLMFRVGKKSMKKYKNSLAPLKKRPLNKKKSYLMIMNRWLTSWSRGITEISSWCSKQVNKNFKVYKKELKLRKILFCLKFSSWKSKSRDCKLKTKNVEKEKGLILLSSRKPYMTPRLWLIHWKSNFRKFIKWKNKKSKYSKSSQVLSIKRTLKQLKGFTYRK